jgi:hypothetical protein
MADGKGSPQAVRVRPREVLTPGAEPPRPFARTGTTVFLAAAYRRSQIDLLAQPPSGGGTPSQRPPGSRPVLTRLASISSMEGGSLPATPLTPPDAGTPRMLSLGSPPFLAGSRFSIANISGRPSCGANSVAATGEPPTITVTVPTAPESKGFDWLGALLGGRARIEPLPRDASAVQIADRAAVTLQRAVRGWRTRMTITRFIEENYAGWERLVDEPKVIAYGYGARLERGEVWSAVWGSGWLARAGLECR